MHQPAECRLYGTTCSMVTPQGYPSVPCCTAVSRRRRGLIEAWGQTAGCKSRTLPSKLCSCRAFWQKRKAIIDVDYENVPEGELWAGGDTHADTNWLSVVDIRGRKLCLEQLPATAKGLRQDLCHKHPDVGRRGVQRIVRRKNGRGACRKGHPLLRGRHARAANVSAARAMPQMHSGLRCRRSMWYTRAS